MNGRTVRNAGGYVKYPTYTTVLYYGRKVPHESCGCCHRNERHDGWWFSLAAHRWYRIKAAS